MGCDKASLEIRGVPLWRRQLETLQQLKPHETFIAGPERAEWRDACNAIVPDVGDGVGPLGALIGSLRRCQTPLLVALAVDLPNMTTDYLRRLAGSRAEGQGIIPKCGDRFEPLAAIYPLASLAIAENLLRGEKYSLQEFGRGCLAQNLIRESRVLSQDEALFLNMNTPADWAAAVGAK